MTEAIAERYGVDLDAPWEELPEEQRDVFLYGTGGEPIQVTYRNRFGRRRSYATRFEGIVTNLAAPLPRDRLGVVAGEDRGVHVAAGLPGLRRRPAAPGVARRARRRARGSRTSARCRRGARWSGWRTSSCRETDRHVARLILREISERLRFLENVGIGYLSMDRAAATLSGGEAQRIRLATQIGSSLVGVLYILDEPSIGLHQRDNSKLIATLERLRDLGNTVIVVEHDEQTMRAADHLVDLGPGAGEHGGRIVAQGTAEAGPARPGVADRPVPLGRPHDRGAGAAAHAERLHRDPRRQRSTTCATSTCTSRWAS